jgi:hypothetical protein
MYGDAHGAGYLLDPIYIGDGMNQQVSNKLKISYLHFQMRMAVQ